jgi:hypothetical protein
MALEELSSVARQLRESGSAEDIGTVDFRRLGEKLSECIGRGLKPPMPPAGPHAVRELTNDSLTPGSGKFPHAGSSDANRKSST